MSFQRDVIQRFATDGRLRSSSASVRCSACRLPADDLDRTTSDRAKDPRDDRLCSVRRRCLSAGARAGRVGLAARPPPIARTAGPAVRTRRPPVHPVPSRPAVVGAVFGPSCAPLGALMGESSVALPVCPGGSYGSVRRRPWSEFRIRQVIWGCVGFSVGVVAIFVWWPTRGTPAPPAGLVLAGWSAGVSGCDNRLSAEVRARESRLQAEFPVVADLLALAVAAGESPVAGLERILRVCHGSLGHEMARVLADIRTGTPIASAFDGLAARTGVTEHRAIRRRAGRRGRARHAPGRRAPRPGRRRP